MCYEFSKKQDRRYSDPKTRMPIPSASSKIFWPCSKFFDLSQYFLNLVKYFWAQSKIIFYLIILHIWAWSKIFDHIPKYWTRSKIFEHIQKRIGTSRWIRHSNLNRDLRCDCMFFLQYLCKRAVRITGKPHTPQRERLYTCFIVWLHF